MTQSLRHAPDRRIIVLAGALLVSPTGGARDSAPSVDRDLDAIGGRQ